MTDHPSGRREAKGRESRDAVAVRTAPDDTEGVAATDAYEVDGGVVLFDIDNPLAWVEAEDVVSLKRMA